MKQRIFSTLRFLRGNWAFPQRESGFIPLLICVLLLVVGMAYLIYLRVQHAQQ